MSNQDALSPQIGAIEEQLSSLIPIAEQRCIYKVHEQLRKVNEEAYKPVLLAIGPYHAHGMVGQGFMEEHKLRYLRQMLERTKGDVEIYTKALMELEGFARKCYVECTSQISPHEFAKMMLLDGCFIIELFRKYETYRVSGNTLNDPIFKMEWVLPRIARDLLLFENQLPFFVLVKLFMMSERNESGNSGELVVDIESSTSTDLSIYKLSELALDFFSCYLPFKWDVDASNYNSGENIRHLVCLMHEAVMHKALVPSLPKLVRERLLVGFRFKNIEFEHLLGLIHTTFSISILDTEIKHEAKVIPEKAEISKPLFGLISEVVIPLLAKRKDMSNQKPLLTREGLEGNSEENMEAETDHGWKWESIPYGVELMEAGITFKTAKKFMDHVIEIQDCNEEIGEENIYGATELEDQAGIKFKKSEKDNMFSIKFNNGLMEVSPLIIEDQTETCLRNLIAYEQYCDRNESLNFVTNYVCFMDGLIQSPKDVELLHRKGIIQNYLGDDVATSTMFNKLCDNINFSTGNIYSRTSRNMIVHCRRRRNIMMAKWTKWMAILNRDYFSTPWAWISFLAAVLLLALTLVQTIFSIIS